MIYPNFRPAFGFLFVLVMSFALSACGNSSGVVSDSSSQSKPANGSSTPSNPAYGAAPVAATPAPAATVQSSPTPTPHPIVKQAEAQPGVPVQVPESMRRPLNSEEMQKALQQLPPEVRARIMGGQKLPAPSPQPTKK